ncbi:hypothetical protein [Myxosarcina sp. GI1]|uniref:hypothetical protein n=1 Tax=Myxosarcina sp. GI1 TaxID=1541065 RepID=UPI000566CB87|nr:hypothetical protein [Myxosarcina sp. GI1]
MNPNNWLTVSSFIAIATLLSIEVGWLTKKGTLPLTSNIPYSEAQQQFLQVWVNIALLIGLIVPIVMAIVFWQQPDICQFFSCYLVAVFIQLASEIGFSRWLCKSVVVTIGTIYTGFRIWQLWYGLQLAIYPQPWLSCLWLVLLFWVANLIMLFTMAYPTIISESKQRV